MPKQTIKDVDVAGQKVFCRVDFNEPVVDGRIEDDFRIRAAIPTINYLADAGAKVILCSHLGRPEGRDPKLSLAPIAVKLGELLRRSVAFVPDTIGPAVQAAAAALKPGEIMLLENVRFYKEEEANDPVFARQLAELAELYADDAFATAHRAHASTEGIAHDLPAYAGLLMDHEITMLDKALHGYKQPLLFMIAGGKVSDKIELIRNFMRRADTFVIGGAMANTFLTAQGLDMGKSIYEPDQIDTALTLLAEFEREGIRVILPRDGLVADAISAEARARPIAALNLIGEGEYLVDIGPETIAEIAGAVNAAGAVIWNGPLGVSEYPQFSQGTAEVARIIAASKAESYIGGGDTVSVIDALGISDQFTFVSTGGGAALEYLEGKSLPGIAVLKDKS